jgi:coenzyme F420-reducing hydrogenase beta subunit
MHNIPEVITKVVKRNLCIGCGLCVYKCPSNALKISWSDLGFLIPVVVGDCDSSSLCLDVCPFNPTPRESIETECKIADLFLTNTPRRHKKIGRYYGIYAGFAENFRLTSSSGGVATFVLNELLQSNLVRHIFTVKEAEGKDALFEYSIISSTQELLAASNTKYFPVSLNDVLQKIHLLDGKIAIVGVPCFIKGLRLAQFYEPKLREKIPFLVGTFCGGVKSRFYTEFLASKLGLSTSNIRQLQYRVKNLTSTADNYSFTCYDVINKEFKTIQMKQLGDMWGTGLFKANACDFCDDVTAELADISLGDAWLDPYNNDGRGANIIISRSVLSDSLLFSGVEKKELKLDHLTVELVIKSQQGNFSHRQNGISARVKINSLLGEKIPPKRFTKEKVFPEFFIVQYFRMKLRKKSLKLWKSGDNAAFENKIYIYRKELEFVTRIYHFLTRKREQIK